MHSGRPLPQQHYQLHSEVNFVQHTNSPGPHVSLHIFHAPEEASISERGSPHAFRVKACASVLPKQGLFLARRSIIQNDQGCKFKLKSSWFLTDFDTIQINIDKIDRQFRSFSKSATAMTISCVSTSVTSTTYQCFCLWRIGKSEDRIKFSPLGGELFFYHV